MIARSVLSLAAIAVAACSKPAPKTPAPPPAEEAAATPVESPETPEAADKPTAPTPPSGDAIGTAHPFIFEGGSYAFDWVIGCQAREDSNGDGKVEVGVGHHGATHGDKMVPYYFAGKTAGEPIDAYVGSSASRRFVAFVQNGKLFLIDAKESARHDLSALGFHAEDDGNPTLHHPALSFGPGGRAAGIRRGKDKSEVVLFDGASGESKVVYQSKEIIWRVDFNSAGDQLSVWELKDDTDKNGKLEPPLARTSLDPRGCRGPPMSYGVYGWSNDKPVETKVKVATVKPSAPPEGFSNPPDTVKNGVVASDKGAVLVGASRAGGLVVGPLEWVRK